MRLFLLLLLSTPLIGGQTVSVPSQEPSAADESPIFSPVLFNSNFTFPPGFNVTDGFLESPTEADFEPPATNATNATNITAAPVEPSEDETDAPTQAPMITPPGTQPPFTVQPSAPSRFPSLSVAPSTNPSAQPVEPATPAPVPAAGDAPAVPGGRVTASAISALPTDQIAVYDLVFTNLWTARAHPFDYPGEDAHWSPPIVASHTSNYQMWEAGALASPGVVVVAETGSPGTLLEEFEAAGTEIGNFTVGVVQFNVEFQTQTIRPVVVDPEHPLLSTITMVAPSPDWFSGFNDFEPSSGGFYYKNFTIETFPYDAGSDSGVTYRSDDLETDPAQVITRFTVANQNLTYPVFISPDGSDITPVLSWTFVLREGTDPTTPPPATSAPSASPVETEPPTGMPVDETSAPVPETTAAPVFPSAFPSVSAMPSSAPTEKTPDETTAPIPLPSSGPSAFPSVSAFPSTNPTVPPTTASPTPAPVETEEPTAQPVTAAPVEPSSAPSEETESPTAAPTTAAPIAPSSAPSAETEAPTAQPVTAAPIEPSSTPSVSKFPSANPTVTETESPTVAPTTATPTAQPVTGAPSATPVTAAPQEPSLVPSVSALPSSDPTDTSGLRVTGGDPTPSPVPKETPAPTTTPPTSRPTRRPTKQKTKKPTKTNMPIKDCPRKISKRMICSKELKCNYKKKILCGAVYWGYSCQCKKGQRIQCRKNNLKKVALCSKKPTKKQSKKKTKKPSKKQTKATKKPTRSGCPTNVRYLSKDPKRCATLRFRCPAGYNPFSNRCGCGCAPGKKKKPTKKATKKQTKRTKKPSKKKTKKPTSAKKTKKPTAGKRTRSPTRAKDCPKGPGVDYWPSPFPQCSFLRRGCGGGKIRFAIKGCGCGCMPPKKTPKPSKSPVFIKTKRPTKNFKTKKPSKKGTKKPSKKATKKNTKLCPKGDGITYSPTPYPFCFYEKKSCGPGRKRFVTRDCGCGCRTVKPSSKPSKKSTKKPTGKPSKKSTKKPTGKPMKKPKGKPSKKPKGKPSKKPSKKFTKKPSKKFTRKPSKKFTKKPSKKFTRKPSKKFTKKPSKKFTKKPSKKATKSRTKLSTNKGCPNLPYISTDPKECQRIRFKCKQGWIPFSNKRCGCGCRKPNPKTTTKKPSKLY